MPTLTPAQKAEFFHRYEHRASIAGLAEVYGISPSAAYQLVARYRKNGNKLNHYGPKPSAESYRINVVLPHEYAARIRQAATASDKSITDWVRSAIDKALDLQSERSG